MIAVGGPGMLLTMSGPIGTGLQARHLQGF